MTKIINKRYTDIDLSLVPNPLTGDIIIKRGNRAIQSNIIHILKSSKFDMLGISESVGVNDLLFENLNRTDVMALESRVKFMLEKYEPRVTIIRTEIEKHYQTLNLRIFYKIDDINEEFTINYTVERSK